MVIPRILISFDVELGWGSLENGLWKARENAGVYVDVRQAMRRLLVAFDDVEVPVVWGFVGKMLDVDGVTHDLLPRSVREQCARQSKSPTWNGLDLLDLVMCAHQRHEIACHSFFHSRFQAEWMCKELAEADIMYCRELFERLGHVPTSFLFPANQAGWNETLSRYGFLCYRARNETEDIAGGALRRKLVNLGRLAGFVKVQTPAPKWEPSLWSIPGGLLFNVPANRRRFLPGLLRRARRTLRDVSLNGGYLHVWAHPYNFAEQPELITLLIALMRDVADLRDKGTVEVLTMEQLQKRLDMESGDGCA